MKWIKKLFIITIAKKEPARSYLYSTTVDYSINNKRTKGEKVHGISESYEVIPLSFRILVSVEANIAYSIIWDRTPLAVKGDFMKGKAKLFDFFKSLLTQDIFEREELEKRIEKSIEFLNHPRIDNIFFHLECGEVYRKNKGDVDIQHKNFFDTEIKNIDTTIKMTLDILRSLKQRAEAKAVEPIKGRFFREKKEKQRDEEVKTLYKEMWKILGIDNWNNVLYYDFRD